ncbi:hypothetical protein SH528x_005629 [Novipirellula sp. SH528]|uniref:hypothetical protein n=1 Tax=Novipirellula sp. SH528 TaxID=3454466 RepID=UPI003FA03714
MRRSCDINTVSLHCNGSVTSSTHSENKTDAMLFSTVVPVRADCQFYDVSVPCVTAEWPDLQPNRWTISSEKIGLEFDR